MEAEGTNSISQSLVQHSDKKKLILVYIHRCTSCWGGEGVPGRVGTICSDGSYVADP